MTDKDQDPTLLGYTSGRNPLYFDPWLLTYRSSGKSTMIMQAIALKLINQGLLEEQHALILSADMLNVIADAVANQGRDNQFRFWPSHAHHNL